MSIPRLYTATPLAAGTEIKGDTTTLEDLNVLARLASAEE